MNFYFIFIYECVNLWVQARVEQGLRPVAPERGHVPLVDLVLHLLTREHGPHLPRQALGGDVVGVQAKQAVQEQVLKGQKK